MTPSISSHVTSLSLSQEMKRLGFPQVSHFRWITSKDKKYEPWIGTHEITTLPELEYFSAYLSSELGEMLPFFINKNHVWAGQLMCVKHPNCFTVSYGTMSEAWIKESADIEADARAKMLIHLAKEGLIKVQG